MGRCGVEGLSSTKLNLRPLMGYKGIAWGGKQEQAKKVVTFRDTALLPFSKT